jgi:molybdopterin adenylyltransferase
MSDTSASNSNRLISLPIGVVTVSDRAAWGHYEDKGGPGIAAVLKDLLITPFHIVARLVPDEAGLIGDTLTELADHEGCCLILTTGGTGPAVRDVTPEATMTVCDKLLPGFGELMRSVSLQEVPTAILSRQTAGVRGQSLIINLPGKPSSIRTCLEAVFPAVPYCLDLIGAYRLEADPARCITYRPRP